MLAWTKTRWFQRLIRNVNRPTIAATIFCSPEIPTYAVYNSSLVVAVPRCHDQSPANDNFKARGIDKEGAVFVSAAFVGVYHQPSSACSVAASISIADGDAYAGRAVIVGIALSANALNAGAVVIGSGTRRRIQADRLDAGLATGCLKQVVRIVAICDCWGQKGAYRYVTIYVTTVAFCDAVTHAATPLPTGAAVIIRQMAA